MFALDFQDLRCCRMSQFKSCGHKKHPVHVEILLEEPVVRIVAKFTVSYYGVKNMLEVPPDLILPAGFRPNLYQ